MLEAGPPSPELANGWAGWLRHERIPFVSYPYEWPFSMLKDAALLQLELLLDALDEDLILKDATPYNVQWRGARPVFIDVGSFEPIRPGEAWAGYRQFCMLLLYPLLLQAYRNVPFRPWLRGSLEGITPEQCASLLSRRDVLRGGVLTHVHLHAKLERSYGDRTRAVKSELRSAGFGTELIRANARKLQKLVRGLEWHAGDSAWTGYGGDNSYTDADAEAKAAFVRAAAGSRAWSLAWDLGCNDGRFSRIAAESARSVVAMDADEAVVDRLYRELRDEGGETILPLVVDVADPSPALGWRNLERKALADRGAPELTLCLALVHHLTITRNIPLPELLGWLRGLGTALVVEFATREDPMVERLLAAKRDGLHVDYDLDSFERHLGDAFEVERSQRLASGTRVLYFARPRV